MKAIFKFNDGAELTVNELEKFTMQLEGTGDLVTRINSDKVNNRPMQFVDPANGLDYKRNGADLVSVEFFF